MEIMEIYPLLNIFRIESESGVILSHPPFCPVLHLTQVDHQYFFKSLKAAVKIFIESVIT